MQEVTEGIYPFAFKMGQQSDIKILGGFYGKLLLLLFCCCFVVVLCDPNFCSPLCTATIIMIAQYIHTLLLMLSPFFFFSPKTKLIFLERNRSNQSIRPSLIKFWQSWRMFIKIILDMIYL